MKIIRLAQSEHLQQVIELQGKYHKDSVGLNGTGFLTYRCPFEELLVLSQELGVIGALIDGVVVGYIILMTSYRASKTEFFRPLIDEYKVVRPERGMDDFAVSAQYCLDSGFRKIVSPMNMFDLQRTILSQRGIGYSIGEADSRNALSLAYLRLFLGYETIGTYNSGEITWEIGERKEAVE